MRIVIAALGVLVSSIVFANPSHEVITACKESRSVGADAIYSDLDVVGRSYDVGGCDIRYDVASGDSRFAYKECAEGNFFMIGDLEIPVNMSVNMSQNPNISPGSLMINLSSWAKILFKEEEYLCVSGPISDVGIGKSKMQYYIVENSFNGRDPIARYYFFDKAEN